MVAVVISGVKTTACYFNYSPHHPHQWEAAQSVAASQVAGPAAGSQVAVEICLQCVVVFISTAEALLSMGLLCELVALSFQIKFLRLLRGCISWHSPATILSPVRVSALPCPQIRNWAESNTSLV